MNIFRTGDHDALKHLVQWVLEEPAHTGKWPKYTKEIINVARRMSDEGTIVLAGRGGDDFV